MKALLILNGDYAGIEILRRLSREADLTICADGGAHHAASAGIPVDMMLGDMDSYTGTAPEGSAVVKYPKEKDLTDGELALDAAIRKGAQSIVIACAGGGRSDHFYGNLLLLKRALLKHIDCSIIDGQFEITLVSGNYCAKTAPGKIFSVLPFSGDFTYQKNSGLVYQIDTPVHVNADAAFGISNEAASNFVEITISDGCALIFKEL